MTGKPLERQEMFTFESDYTEGCHEAILKRLAETNLVQVSGYGEDPFTRSAKEKIREACGCKTAQVTFVAGGTQTNQLVIDTMLQPYEGVVAAESGHVNVHEAGAIEFTGHKVMALPQHEGQMRADELKDFLATFYADGNHEHMVFPGMVYITHPTELGTLYTKAELEAISEVCHSYSIPLFLDGARLGYGLMSKGTDVTLPLIAELTDVFYIGGTKVGALIGEAVVFTKNNQPAHFVTRVKQHGALLAKGRLIGIQFETLFTDGLYFKIAGKAIELAERMKAALKEKGYRFYLETPTNQQFLIMENEKLEELGKKVGYSFWEKYDDTHTVIRFCTSWATTEENLQKLIELL